MDDLVKQARSLRLFDADLTRGVSQTFVDSVLILGPAIQKDRYPGEHDKLKHVPQTDLLHIANGLAGNLGRIAFTVEASHVLRGLDWVAPSTSVAVQVTVNSEARGGATVILCPTRKSKKIRVIRGRKDQRIFPPLFPSKERKHDSEYLLINYLGLQLQLEGHTDSVRGEVILATERIPCEHCLKVIRQFAKKYPCITCNVVYMYETEGRQPASLITNDLQANIHLYKLALSLRGADATRITADTPNHALTFRVLEQAQSTDSSAHVSSRAIPSFTIRPRVPGK